MKLLGYTPPGMVKLWEAYEAMPGFKVKTKADARYSVPVYLKDDPLPATMADGDGWWNDDGNIYTVPIDFPNWGARIEVRGHSIDEARALAQRVLEGIT